VLINVFKTSINKATQDTLCTQNCNPIKAATIGY